MAGDQLYRQLQEDLDRMPVGFPPTASGVEIRILKQLFTPEEARIALATGMLLEPVATIHRRLGGEPGEAELAETLAAMARRGLIRSESAPAGPRYGKLPFVIGIYEGQVDRMTPELAHDLLEYFDLGLGKAIRPGATPQLRAVPVNRAIDVDRFVAPYDDIRQAVRKSPGPFAVMNCICRQANDLAGHSCQQTEVRENCLTMGSAATVMMQHGQAREISRERMLELLDEADREGLVLEPQNTLDPQFICLCCGCCCVSLKAARQLERPAGFFRPNYYAEVNANECIVCGTCHTRCQMDAVLVADTVEIDRDYCIGCGLCLSTCPTGAVKMKPAHGQGSPPGSTQALYAKIYRERYGTLQFAKTAVRLLTHR